MKIEELLQIKTELSSLTVFRSLLKDEVIAALNDYFETLKYADIDSSVSAYSRFVCLLYNANGGKLTEYVESICFNSENIYVKMIGNGEIPPEYIKASVVNELDILSRIAVLTAEQLSEPISSQKYIPSFKSGYTDILKSYEHRVNNIEKYGYGKYAANGMFYIDGNADIIPVTNPDKVSLESLIDYNGSRQRIIDNTVALLNGKPAANILLTGDAGTGKSSTVKAIANEYYNDGLRIIEVRKEQLDIIPTILDELSENPLKFILFIDDLAFLSDDDKFNGLKAVLEGSVSARSKNVVVYATSNRRHIIKEKFSDREGDEIHRNDVMQEMISLSDRFGLHITFQRPNKAAYLDIVHRLANQSSLQIDVSELELKAERFALERGGRSARLARQFIDALIANSQA